MTVRERQEADGTRNCLDHLREVNPTCRWRSGCESWPRRTPAVFPRSASGTENDNCLR